jgi:hypothetical protein
MATGVIIGIVIGALVVLVVGAFLARPVLRSRQLRQRFGPEYDRVVEAQSGRKEAEQELTERERRFANLEIHPITATSRDRYAQNWALIQAKFVDRPSNAVDDAERLLISIMDELGYPTSDYEERLAVLSVFHVPVLTHYRDANDITGRHEISQVSTEELRVAMVHYRTLIEELLDAKPIAPKAPRSLRPAQPESTKSIRPAQPEPETRLEKSAATNGSDRPAEPAESSN